ncbi:MAG TPA: DNA internalization-related competence protein ComEC/Rec2 [Gemmatimonadaceae bacterium]|nr:DNA internalization-related competence protein ComEC/Rec2 [Gemmatimonadaceae bacterium]
MPLIALAYASFACGLVAGFEGLAVIAAPFALCFTGVGFLLRRTVNGSLGLIFIGGVLAALASQPARLTREREPAGNQEHELLMQARARASHSIDVLFGSDAPMARALLIADQHRIPPEMRDRYARAGMIHMLSISGLHVAIVAGAVMLLLRAARLSRAFASALGVVITVFYVAVIGAPAPAVRSAAMLALVAASRATQRPTSPWAGLALGAFVPLVRPVTILDLGYQLSVAGIAGLIASGVLARRMLAPRVDGWSLKIGKELLTSVVATLVTAPLIAWYFGRISLIAPLANLAAGPVISVLQPTLFAALALAPVPAVAQLFADAAHPLLLAFDGIATASAAVPGASVSVIPSIASVIAGGAAVTALLVACTSRYPGRPVVTAAGCLCIIAWAPALPLPYKGGVEMHVLDVGQGDAILLRSDRGRWIVFDAGRIWSTGDAGRSTIIPYIRMRGGDVEAFVLSHAHADHVGGAESLIRSLHPHVFWDSAFPQASGVYQTTLQAARASGTEWRRVHAGEVTHVDGVTVEFLAPDSSWTASLSDPNEASTIALVTYGSTRILLVGDAEAAEEAWLLDHSRPELHADVLKVGHHGSSTSSTDAFLNAVNPRLAIISVGADNLYGHPSTDVLAALGRVGARTMRTDRVGTIVVRTDGQHLTMEAGGERWDISRQ